MTYHDLPRDWATRPVNDPAITADVIDLLVSDEDRDRGCLVLLLTHADGRLFQPCAVTDLADGTDEAERRQVLRLFVTAMGEERGGILVVRGRPGPSAPTDDDRAWHQAAIDVTRESDGVALLGCHVATPNGIVELPVPEPVPA